MVSVPQRNGKRFPVMEIGFRDIGGREGPQSAVWKLEARTASVESEAKSEGLRTRAASGVSSRPGQGKKR